MIISLFGGILKYEIVFCLFCYFIKKQKCENELKKYYKVVKYYNIIYYQCIYISM